MLMAQRYPPYFDGVVSGAPAMRTSFSGIGDRWVAVTLNEIAPKNAQGQPVTREALSDSDKKTVIDGLVNACDAGDGAEGRPDLQHRRLQVRSEGARLQRREGGRLPVDCAGGGAREGVRRAARTRRARQVYPGVSVRHRHRRDAGIAGPAARRAAARSARCAPSSEWTSMQAVEQALANPAESLTDTSQVDQPEHLLRTRRQADLLARRERPLVLGARHGRLLRAPDEGERRPRAGAGIGAACSCHPAWGTAAADRRSTASTR